MRCTRLDRCLIALFVLSVAVAGQSVVSAPRLCSPGCTHIRDFVSKPAPGELQWRRFEFEDCSVCVKTGSLCRSVAVVGGSCEPDPSQSNKVATATAGVPMCNLALGGWAQAKNLVGVTDFVEVGLKHSTCKPTLVGIR